MRHPPSPFRDVDRFYEVFALQRSKEGPSQAEVEASIRKIPGIVSSASARFASIDVDIGEGVERSVVAYSSPVLFSLAGVKPRRGRLPTADDMLRGGVVMVSDELWHRRFNDRAHLEGATLSMNGQTFSIIGVMPTGATLRRGEVWVPDSSMPPGTSHEVFVRVASSNKAARKAIETQLTALSKRWTSIFSKPGEKTFAMVLWSMAPDPLELKDFHYAMIGAAICVLIIACANVAALMLARGMVRRRDYALRLALGSSRGEIAREVIVEVATLAVAGCVAGALIATWAIGLLTRIVPQELHWQGFAEPQWSMRVLALSAVAVFVSVAIAGGFPAWQASHTDPMAPLKESGGGTTGRAGTRFRWLIMAELSLAMMLVMIASLLMKSTTKMSTFDFGYDARGLLSVEVQLSSRDSIAPAARAAMYQQLLSRIKALPGVRDAASFVQCDFSDRVLTSDRTVEGGKAAYVAQGCYQGSSGLFHTIGIDLVDGRDFIDGDDAGIGAVILDQRTAAKLFPHERAIGRLIKLGAISSGSPFMPVVGVVRNHDLAFNRYPETGPDTSDRVYVAPPFMARRFGDMVIRPNTADEKVKLAITRVLRSTMPPRSTVNIQPWFRSYQDQLRAEQFLSILFSMLGGASLLLGAAGLFSVISYVAGQRMREFAVRIALGATNRNVLRLVMREAFLMALGGTGVGAGLGMWAGFLLWDKMWGVYPVDAQALIAGEATLLIVTMLACLAPALRATKANPVEVLRAA